MYIYSGNGVPAAVNVDQSRDKDEDNESWLDFPYLKHTNKTQFQQRIISDDQTYPTSHLKQSPKSYCKKKLPTTNLLHGLFGRFFTAMLFFFQFVS